MVLAQISLNFEKICFVAMNEDIRWKQRFSNYKKALVQLNDFCAQPSLNEREEQGMIKAFEYCYELGWNVLKDYLEAQGYTEIRGAVDAIRQAFKVDIVSDGEGWMDMYRDRNKTAHTYNIATADEVAKAIKGPHLRNFVALETFMDNILHR